MLRCQKCITGAAGASRHVSVRGAPSHDSRYRRATARCIIAGMSTTVDSLSKAPSWPSLRASLAACVRGHVVRGDRVRRTVRGWLRSPTPAATTRRPCNFFVPLAEEGNRDAEYSVGVMYSNGRGLPQSYVEAAKWFHRAADKGQAGAQYDLGVLYAKGQGVKEDSARSREMVSQGRRPGQGKRPIQPRLTCTPWPGRGAGFRRGGEVVSQGGRPGRRGFAKPPGGAVPSGRRRAAGLRRSGQVVSQGGRPGRHRRAERARTRLRQWPGRAAGLRRGVSVVRASRHRAMRAPISRCTTMPSRIATSWPAR